MSGGWLLGLCEKKQGFQKGEGLHLGFGMAWINARCPPKPLYCSPSSAGQREET